MKKSLFAKLSAFGLLALAAGACTVTTSSSGDGGSTADSGSNPPADSSTDATKDAAADVSACAAEVQCPAFVQFSFDNCGQCDTCLATNCCDSFTSAATASCFSTPDGQKPSDCNALYECLLACDQSDADIEACKAGCQEGHPDGYNQIKDYLVCFNNQCASACQ